MNFIAYGICLLLCLATTVLSAPGAGSGDKEWNATPNDVNNLLKSMKDLINVSYKTEVASLDQIDSDPAKNPILYLSLIHI